MRMSSAGSPRHLPRCPQPHTHMHTNINTQTHKHTQKHTHWGTHIHRHKPSAHAHKRTRTSTRTRARTRARTRTRRNTKRRTTKWPEASTVVCSDTVVLTTHPHLLQRTTLFDTHHIIYYKHHMQRSQDRYTKDFCSDAVVQGLGPKPLDQGLGFLVSVFVWCRD